MSLPKYNPRRPLDDDKPDGYMESDKDYMENNRFIAVALLDAYAAKQQDEPVAWYSHCTDPAQIHPERHGRLCFYGATCPDDYPTPIRFTERDKYEWRPLFTAPPKLSECQAQLEMAEAVIAGDGALIAGLKNDLAECQARETSLRDDMKLASVQYMGCGGNLRPQEVVDAMLRVLNRSLATPSNSTALDEALKQAKREVLNDEAAAWADIKLHAAKIGDDWLGTFADTMLAAITKELE
jgi:hypothetical protein